MNVVSVIVPVFQCEKYLRQCIDSILNQTYKEIELLLIDDGSTDQSPMICDSYKEKDSRVKVIHKQNEGVAKARNIGLDQSSGKYIMFVDSDDWVELDMVEKMIKILEQQKADIVECGYIERKNPICTSEIIKEDICILDNKEKIFYHSIVPGMPYLYKVCWGKIFRDSVCAHVRFPNRTIAEDAAFCNQVFLNCQKIVKTNAKYYNYRITPGSIMHSNIKPAIFESLDTVIDMYNMLMKDNCVYSERFWRAMDEHVSNCAIGIADQIVWKGYKLTDIGGFENFYEKCQIIKKNMSNPTKDFLEFTKNHKKWSKFRRVKLLVRRVVSKAKRIIK